MSEQITDLVESVMPGPTGYVTPSLQQLHDETLKYAAGTKRLQDAAVAGLVGDVSSAAYLSLLDFNGVVTPERFGALGDGMHDDSSALQQAIDYGAEHKRTVWLSSRTYRATMPLVLHSGTHIVGGYSNDEYSNESVIVNESTDFFTITDAQIHGVKIRNVLFRSAEGNAGRWLDSGNVLAWSEIVSCGFMDFDTVFDLNLLGVKMTDLWINKSHSVGAFRGTDSMFRDWFVASNMPRILEGTLLTLSGLSLSRFENIYFTGITGQEMGVSTILRIGGYSRNLVFHGCWLDYSFGPAVDIRGSDNDFPNSGVCNVTFDSCLFRSNCTDAATARHVVNLGICRNVMFENNAFNKPVSIEAYHQPNPDSRIYNLLDYAQDVMLLHNFYETGKTNVASTAWNDVTDLDRYYNKPRNLGYSAPDNSLAIFNNRLQAHTHTGTTDATYGAVTVPLGYTYTQPPIVLVECVNSQWTAHINKTNVSSMEIIIRDLSGNPVKSKQVTVTTLAIGPTL